MISHCNGGADSVREQYGHKSHIDRIKELEAEIIRLQVEVSNRNARALAGDKAVAVNEQLVDEIENQAALIETLASCIADDCGPYLGHADNVYDALEAVEEWRKKA